VYPTNKISSCVSKQKKSNSVYKHAQKSEYILTYGFEVVPCTRCMDKDIGCFIIPSLNRYAMCIRAGCSYDSTRSLISLSEYFVLYLFRLLTSFSSREDQPGVIVFRG
jgi:hypothetical protein